MAWVPKHPANVAVGDFTPAGQVVDTDGFGEMHLWCLTVRTPEGRTQDFSRRSTEWVDVWVPGKQPMTPSELEVVIGLMVGKTWAPADRLRNAVLLRGVAPEDREAVQRLIMDAHREHLNWLTMTQRRWQRETRRPGRARHHDSISIREKYVRCAA